MNDPSTIFKVIIFSVLFSGFFFGFTSCKKELVRPTGHYEFPDIEEEEGEDYFLPDIDLNHWKVTLPIGDGSPIEITPPEILDYANNEILQDFMYNDSTDGSLVFYTYPGGVTTANSSYPRTELREQMVPGSNTTNWTFEQGGKMTGTLSVPDISTDSNNNPHRVIVMQIHGRLTDAQRDLIGENDNNAPPVLKIYWYKGLVRVKTKVLKNVNTPYPEILKVDSWGDDDGFNFDEYVGQDKFKLEIQASAGKMSITLNDKQTVIYDGIHMEKWGIFENYFKAGNYLSTTSEGAYSYVKYYDLEVSH